MTNKPRRKRPNRPFIPRAEFKFWLRRDREGDVRLMEFIQYCKSTRQWAKVARDGIRLIWSLREGNTDVLFELFPHLEAQFASRFAPPAPDTGDLENRLAARIDTALREALLHAPALPATTPVAQSGTIGQGKAFSAPPSDDDDDMPVMAIKKVDNGEKPPQFDSGLLAWIMNPDATLGGKNLTAEDNAKSIAGRRQQ